MGILFQDTFVDTDSTLLTAHTPAPINGASCSYSAAAGAFKIESDAAIPTGYSPSAQIAVLNPDLSDSYTISLKIIIPDGASTTYRRWAGFVFRYSDANNYWLLSIANDNNNIVNGSYVKLTKVVAGTSTDYSLQGSLDLNATTQTISVTVSGSSITCSLGSTTYSAHTGDTFNESATQFGLWEFANGNNHTNQYDYLTMSNLEFDYGSPVEGACLLI